MERVRVAILFGGRSGEHAVSLRSARSVAAALDPSRFEALGIGITPDGHWVAVPDIETASQAGLGLQTGVRVTLLAEPSSLEGGRVRLRAVDPEHALPPLFDAPVDVVWPVLHGTFGEDGTVQGLLELAGVAYVGSGVAASALGMDKILSKAVFAAHGFPIVRQVELVRTDYEAHPEQAHERIERELGYPCFTKPANLGSSVGISKVRSREQLEPALREACRYDRRVVIEAGLVPVRELEVAVLGNDTPEASVVGEVVPSGEFYDYEAKYIKDDSRLDIPAVISPELAQRVRTMACAVYCALDLAGLSRVDFLYHEPTDMLYLNEVNTLPGFTSISMYPKLWEASGLPYAQLTARLVELALERHREKARSSFLFQ